MLICTHSIVASMYILYTLCTNTNCDSNAFYVSYTVRFEATAESCSKEY